MTKAWDAFARSQKDDVTITKKVSKDKDGNDVVETTTRTRGQAGDARYLSEVREILRQIDLLFGLPEVRISDESGNKLFSSDVARAFEQMMEQLGDQQTVPVVDAQVIESHVLEHSGGLHEGNGNGKPQTQGEDDEECEEDE